jgi:SlyX protein
MENRLVELETRLAFQEDTLQALNGIVSRQQQEILMLSRELEALRAQIRALSPALVASRSEEPPPPHY